jgi:L-fucose mutarotase
MLKGIHPLLHADLLHALASMGHGDELVVADANFPAASIARRLIHASGASAPDALDAILTVFPLDTFLRPAALTMQVVGDATAIPQPVKEFAEVFARHGRAAIDFGKLLLVKGVVNAYPPAG